MPQFNSALGTLTGVQVNFGVSTVSATTAISDVENNVSNINITYDLGYLLSVFLPDGEVFAASGAPPLTCAASAPGAEILTCSNGVTFTQSVAGSSFDLTSQSALFLAGPVALNYSPNPVEILVGTPLPNPPANLNLSVTNESISTPSTVTFTYTTASTTPEPAAPAMAMVGLAVFFLLRRRLRAAPRI
jgi:MYXO-CTERM domain-containing protein